MHPDELSASFHACLAELVSFDGATDNHLGHDSGRIAIRCGTDGLVAARNTAVQAFLAGGADWLLWTDTDMGFAPDALARLMAVANPDTHPIVGALCFSSRQVAHDGMHGFRTAPLPTILHWRETDAGKHFTALQTYPINTVVRCNATGSAFILIHRSVFEAIGAGWYDRVSTEHGLLGEDVSFCTRAGAKQIAVHVHTGVRTTHLKPQWVAEPDYWQHFLAPPAIQEVAVIVPVLGRPEHADLFMASLRASSGLATAYVVADRADEKVVTAWKIAGAQVLCGDEEQVGGQGPVARTFAQKINLGYRQTSEPWLFMVGSDVRFWPGWLDHAQHVATTFAADVIGTNDLGSQRVRDGEHSPHLLIRRSYADKVGASWDGPDQVCHEGYRHWYVDDEIVTAAKARGVWEMAPGSIVEHLHPLFDKAPDDEVYRLGQSHAEADRERFEQRVRKYLQVRP